MRAVDPDGTWGATASVELVVSPAPPAVPTLFFSTLGSVSLPGVAAPFDNSDIYSWDETAYSRVLDATVVGLLASANVDAYDRVDATHYYLSFAANTAVPGIGTVQDEDVVYNNNGVWSVYFDGTAHSMTTNSRDLDAIGVVGGTLYFSTVGNSNPLGVTGTADDADIYSWNGTSYARVWDASANGLAGGVDVDGLEWVDATHFYLSFTSQQSCAGSGNGPGRGRCVQEQRDLVGLLRWNCSRLDHR